MQGDGASSSVPSEDPITKIFQMITKDSNDTGYNSSIEKGDPFHDRLDVSTPLDGCDGDVNNSLKRRCESVQSWVNSIQQSNPDNHHQNLFDNVHHDQQAFNSHNNIIINNNSNNSNKYKRIRHDVILNHDTDVRNNICLSAKNRDLEPTIGEMTSTSLTQPDGGNATQLLTKAPHTQPFRVEISRNSQSRDAVDSTNVHMKVQSPLFLSRDRKRRNENILIDHYVESKKKKTGPLENKVESSLLLSRHRKRRHENSLDTFVEAKRRRIDVVKI